MPYSPEPWQPGHRAAYQAMGADLVGMAMESDVVDRADALHWVAGLVTDRGVDRAATVAYCGTSHVARRGAQWGPQPTSCKERACPRCMKRRQRTMTRLARDFVGERMAGGARMAMATLTQVKLPVEHESCEGACDRMLDAWRETMNQKSAGGRFVRLFFAGGLRALEVTIPQKGGRRKDGSYVAYTGWHAHLHVLLEESRPSLELVDEAARFVAREVDGLERRRAVNLRAGVAGVVAAIDRKRKDLDRLARLVEGVRDGLVSGREVVELWTELGRNALVWRWLDVCPEANRGAQDFQSLDDVSSVGQVTKYVTKPFGIRDPRLAREVFSTIESRHCLFSFGTWRSWQREAKALEEEEAKGARDVEVSRTPMGKVIDAARQGVRSMVVDFGGYEVAVSPATVLADVRARRGDSFAVEEWRARAAAGEIPDDAMERHFREYHRTLGWLAGQRGIPRETLIPEEAASGPAP